MLLKIPDEETYYLHHQQQKKFHDNMYQKCRALGICKLTTAGLQKYVKVCDCQALHKAGQKKANVNNQHQ